MARAKIILYKDRYRNTEIIWCKLVNNKGIDKKISDISGARYSKSREMWFFKENEFNLNIFYKSLSSVAYIDYSALKERKKLVPEREKKQNGRQLISILNS
jgi:hypothetical protein